jgi:uncharacterized protein with PIN domain
VAITAAADATTKLLFDQLNTTIIDLRAENQRLIGQRDACQAGFTAAQLEAVKLASQVAEAERSKRQLAELQETLARCAPVHDDLATLDAEGHEAQVDELMDLLARYRSGVR